MASRGRRRFLKWGLAGAAGVAWPPGPARAAKDPPPAGDKPPPATNGQLPEGKMPMRKLGRTGVDVSLVGLGGYHIGQAPDEQTATRIIRAAIDHGVNFMDNCWDYNDGKSHVWMGRALRDGYRKRAFLMTKIDGRTRAAATAQIEQSLRDLATDTIDLMQVHEVIRGTDPDRVFGPDGAMEALVAAKKAGKIRFIGFTGHKSPRIHLKMLEVAAAHHFPFDTVQMPLNVMDAHRDSFERLVMPAATAAGVAVLAMKPLGSGVFFKSGPLARKQVSPVECLRYSMGSPASVVITGCQSMRDLAQALEAAYKTPAMTEAERKVVLARTAPAGTDGQWEKYKVSDMFDGTARNPHWLETAKL
jgi:aryl-alcohol dehydrogenase-like predicted oxidoreductase